jgi:hypothetical protein
MNYNINSGYGLMLATQIAAAVGPVFGKIHVVISTSDEQYKIQMLREMFVPDVDGRVRFYNTLETAYAAVTSNADDIILLAGNSTHSVAAGIAWSKSRVHVIGMDGGGRIVQQGAKVELSGAVDSAYVLKVTGVRNSFVNVKFIQSSTHANALTVVQEGGEGTLWKNCSFVFGVADNLGGTTAHEFLAGSDSATYSKCLFGTETLLTSAARSVFHIDQVTASQEFKSNVLEDCVFVLSSSSSTATFIRLDAVGDILFTNTFIRPVFVASVDSAGGAAIAETVQTGTGTSKGVLVFAYPATFNSTDFATATGGRNAAVQIVAPVPTAGTSGIGVTPTA